MERQDPIFKYVLVGHDKQVFRSEQLSQTAEHYLQTLDSP